MSTGGSVLARRFEERIAFLRRLPDAGWRVLSAYTAVRLLSALVPAGTALATEALLNGAVRDAILLPLLALSGILLAGQLGTVAEPPFRAVLEGRINGAHRSRLAARVAGAGTISRLEDAAVQDLVRTATADPMDWVEKTPADGALTELSLLIRFVGLFSAAAVVARWSLWLVPLIVLPAMLVRLITVRQWVTHYRIWTAGISHSRRYLYWGEVSTTAAEGKELRVFGLARWLIGKHQGHMHQHLDPVWADDARSARVVRLRLVVTALPLGTAYLVVGMGAARGEGAVSLAAAVLAAAWGIFTTMGQAGDAVNTEGARPVLRADRALDDALGRPPAAAPETGRSPVAPGAPLIRFEHVSFRYPGADRPVLTDVHLEIRPGEMLALVGMNGAGKSTLTNLLAGLYPPTSGRITADGAGIETIDRWQRRISVVFQDFVRYPLSLRDNIVLGQATAVPDEEKMRMAAHDAGLDPVVERLARGWDTPISVTVDGGVDLSGGQWQQVALARALYAVRHDARILVLDEPTAHLDVRTEAQLFQKLIGRTDGITTLLISHRLSTVRQADRIILLDGGRVTESGTHDELMAGDGRYAEMYRLQAERFNRGLADWAEPEAAS
ncbi:ABC transporter ATP-binding protein [Paractinoplanes rishiriensis]|uniref:ABC transporter ATP-binding protein n=1 Tax=Paractinoplanes rishiriensis TaxID=1050105 RepID=UPI001944FB76|nr:ABC transporter ATP-binding protein [Actinoplanes rishiriensis]